MRYVIAIIIIILSIPCIKGVISEFQKRICNRKKIIARGVKKINYELIYGILNVLIFVLFGMVSYSKKPSMWLIICGIVNGICGPENILKGIQSEIREDGIYTNKGIYKWNKIQEYKHSAIKKRNIILNRDREYSSLRFFIEGGYSKKVIINVAIKDIEQVENFFDEIGLKQQIS